MLKVRLLGPWISRNGRLSGGQTGKKMGMLMPKEDESDLNFMRELLEAGQVVPVIDKKYPFNELPEAIRYLEKGHARGKVVITM